MFKKYLILIVFSFGCLQASQRGEISYFDRKRALVKAQAGFITCSMLPQKKIQYRDGKFLKMDQDETIKMLTGSCIYTSREPFIIIKDSKNSRQYFLERLCEDPEKATSGFMLLGYIEHKVNK